MAEEAKEAKIPSYTVYLQIESQRGVIRNVSNCMNGQTWYLLYSPSKKQCAVWMVMSDLVWSCIVTHVDADMFMYIYTVVYSYAWWWKAWLHGHLCSSMFMHSHVQLCIVMHGGGRLGCMVMYADACSCIVMYSCI